MKTKTIDKKRPVKTTAMTTTTPSRVSRRGRINEGRPPLWTDPKAFETKSDEYFRWCDARLRTFIGKDGEETTQNCPEPPTMAKWAAWMGWTDRDGHVPYMEKPEFAVTIKRARLRIEGEVERLLLEGRSPVGAIFWLKNNATNRYRDKFEQEITGADGKPLGPVVVLLDNSEQKAL